MAALITWCVILCAGCRGVRDDGHDGTIGCSSGACSPDSVPHTSENVVHASGATSAVDAARNRKTRNGLPIELTSPKVRDLVSDAYQYYENAEPEKSIETLVHALEIESDNQRVRTILAITLALEGYINASEREFIKAVGVAEAHYNLGVILFELGEITEAEQRFLLAVQHNPALTDAHVWLSAVRTEIATQTARWHNAINPLPLPTGGGDVIFPAAPAPVLAPTPAPVLAPTPAPVPINVLAVPINEPAVVIVSAEVESESDQTLPEISPARSPLQALTAQQWHSDSPPADMTFHAEESGNSAAAGPVTNSPPLPELPLPTSAVDTPGTPVQAATTDSPPPDWQVELDRLRHEIERLRIEREILKKAIGVIAGDNL